MPIWGLVLIALWGRTATGQDAVSEKQASGKVVRRQGEILDWKGLSISIEVGGRVREIDNQNVEAFETRWPQSLQQARDLRAAGRRGESARGYLEAIGDEPRPWAANIIRAELIPVQVSLRQTVNAVGTFAQIVAIDPHSRFLHLAPLQWTGREDDDVRGDVARAATSWRASGEPALQLLGASWAGRADRDEARELLTRLASDLDPTVAGLATAQLWRLRDDVLTAGQLEVWQQRLDRMPTSSRAGPIWVLASAMARAELHDEAAEQWMRIVVLHRDQENLAAPALYEVARLMHNDGRTPIASSLMSELRSTWPWHPRASESFSSALSR